MSVIYEPSGRAREYSELACNLYTGCLHKCKYCYCPAIMRKSIEEWSKNAHARTRILKKMENDLKKLPANSRNKELLFCFMCDPYQSEEAAFLTRQALLLCEKYQMTNIQVLTKAGYRCVKDFDIFQRNKNWKFAQTIIFRSESLREEWEPGAPSISSRYKAVKIANELGIKTWVSIEPVIDPEEALNVISDLIDYVDKWKIGKLNHFKDIENQINWEKFIKDCKKLLVNKDVYYKKDLRKYEE